ncbi:histidine kinase N-terminal 7TM domain-containing protein [Halovenus marina]|uniref:histidine kinase N-terminal 7TM domain-containing protein n=1 Tax=Halovenus marina TaxID=3396621 RepID=UPI003F5580C7
MGWSVSAVAFVIFGSAVVAVMIGLAALRKRPDPMAWPLALLTFAAAAWALPHAISLGYTNVEQVAFWHRIRYPGTVFAPVFYLVIALKYAGYGRWLSRRVYAGLAVIPVVTIVVVWTNPYHGLFWESLAVTSASGATAFTPDVGPWYWVNLGYLYLLTVSSLGILAGEVVRSSRVYRKQTAVMFLGGFVPLVTNVAVNVDLGPSLAIDLTTTTLTISGFAFALALFYLDLLDVQPVARNRLFEELEDGVVVIGPNGLIRDFNSTAAQIIEGIAIEQPATELFPAHITPDGGEFVTERDGAERIFRTRSTSLTDEHDQEIGRIVYLNEVTELVKREQRISVLNRVLRHNIRNELNVVTGRLELLQENAGDDERRENATIALEKTRRVTEFAEKARHVERTLQASETTIATSATDVVEHVVESARETHPGAVIEYRRSVEDDTAATASVVDERLFEMALTELIENAVVHNDRTPPRVIVRITPSGDHLQIEVADNGPGIDESETEVLGDRTETHLKHGSGLGLWLVHWTASLSGGELLFADNDPRGSAVTLSLPRVEQS